MDSVYYSYGIDYNFDLNGFVVHRMTIPHGEFHYLTRNGVWNPTREFRGKFGSAEEACEALAKSLKGGPNGAPDENVA